MGRAKETKRMRDEAREARKSDRLRKAAEKFADEREHTAPALRPMNKKQQKYLDYLGSRKIIIVNGVFGSGKTFMASAYAGDLLRKNEIDKIIVARPYVQTGKTSGFKPGNAMQKLWPYLRSMMDTICRRVGKGAFAAMLGDGQNSRIEICEVESIRGRSFDERCFVLIDEAQQTNPEEMLSIITRISDQATLVIMGDNSQRDIPGKSGLAWVTDFFTRHPDPEVGMISFDNPDDVVRSGLGRQIALNLIEDRANHIWTPVSE